MVDFMLIKGDENKCVMKWNGKIKWYHTIRTV